MIYLNTINIATHLLESHSHAPFPLDTGTKHIDPNTGLIYFKYDFGYEFGILFPGEGRKFVEKSGVADHPTRTLRTRDIEVPVIHECTRRADERSFNEDPTKRYSLPINIDLDHLHDPINRVPLPERGSLNVVFNVCCLRNGCKRLTYLKTLWYSNYPLA